jgi:multiple sugar transport system permease protein
MKIIGKKGLLKLIPFYLALGAILIFILFPFYWTLVTALKPEADIYKVPIEYLPAVVTFHNFMVAWKNVGFSIFFHNSFIVSLVSVAIIVTCSILIGYALSRFRFRGKAAFLLLMLSTQFIPQSMLIIPLFIIFKNMHLINSLGSLIFTYITFQIPFNAIIMRGFVNNIPFALEEAAMVDGCGRIKAICLTVLPILLPGLIATGAFAFIGCWNEFLCALMFINSKALFTIPVGLNYMQGQFDVNYGALAAGSIIALIPPILMFAYVQKYLVQGLGAGSVKG